MTSTVQRLYASKYFLAYSPITFKAIYFKSENGFSKEIERFPKVVEIETRVPARFAPFARLRILSGGEARYRPFGEDWIEISIIGPTTNFGFNCEYQEEYELLILTVIRQR